MEEHVSLAQYTTFRIGGEAAYFFRISNNQDLTEAITFIHERGLPFFILGGGSNILVSDAGFGGVILKMEMKGLSFENREDGVLVTAGAGEDWDSVVEATVNEGLSGLEHLSYIPGSVGAAPVQNIGAYGREFDQVCESIDAVNVQTGKQKTFSKEESGFQYRNSFWKTEEGKQYIIVRVRMLLQNSNVSSAEYKDVKEYFNKNGGAITPQTVREAVIYIRKNKLPDVRELGTAGSFFKNPIITKEQYEDLKRLYPELPKFDAPNNMVKIPAAWVLDHVCRLKGYREGNVGLYEKQPLAVVNFSHANEKEVVNFVKHISEIFFNATKINLEWEVIHIC